MSIGDMRLDVVFFRTDSGTEPVRKWLKSLLVSHKKSIGEDIKTVQFGWPLGMPLVRKIEPYLWEVRTKVPDGIARTLFTVDGNLMILLHGFIKKTKKDISEGTSNSQIQVKAISGGRIVKNKHVGSSFDDFLKEEELLVETEATAAKRVLAYQIQKEMAEQHISKSDLARRMHSSRSSLERLLDPENPSVTLLTLENVAIALGKRLKIQIG